MGRPSNRILASPTTGLSGRRRTRTRESVRVATARRRPGSVVRLHHRRRRSAPDLRTPPAASVPGTPDVKHLLRPLCLFEAVEGQHHGLPLPLEALEAEHVSIEDVGSAKNSSQYSCQPRPSSTSCVDGCRCLVVSSASSVRSGLGITMPLNAHDQPRLDGRLKDPSCGPRSGTAGGAPEQGSSTAASRMILLTEC